MSRDLFTNQLLTLAHIIEIQTKGKYSWKSSMLLRETRNKCSCNDNKWFLYMAWHKLRSVWLKELLQSKTCVWAYFLFKSLILSGSLRYGILLMRSSSSNQRESLIEFIFDVQSLTQYGKGKWWRNQPKWLVRGTKQVLVKRRLTMCELLGWSC